MFIVRYFMLLFLSYNIAIAMNLTQINKASKEELMRIKGIGEAKANTIISSRPFKSMQELDDVKGVGEVLMDNITNNIYKKSAGGNTNSSKTSKSVKYNSELDDEDKPRKKVNVIHFEK